KWFWIWFSLTLVLGKVVRSLFWIRVKLVSMAISKVYVSFRAVVIVRFVTLIFLSMSRICRGLTMVKSRIVGLLMVISASFGLMVMFFFRLRIRVWLTSTLNAALLPCRLLTSLFTESGPWAGLGLVRGTLTRPLESWLSSVEKNTD